MSKIEDTINDVLEGKIDDEEGAIRRTLAIRLRNELYVALLDRAQEVQGTDYRMGYEDGIRETARWVLRDA